MAATLYLNNSKELDLLLGYLHLPPKLIEISKKRRFGKLGIPVCIIYLLVYRRMATVQSLATAHSRFFVADDTAHPERGVIGC